MIALPARGLWLPPSILPAPPDLRGGRSFLRDWFRRPATLPPNPPAARPSNPPALFRQRNPTAGGRNRNTATGGRINDPCPAGGCCGTESGSGCFCASNGDGFFPNNLIMTVAGVGVSMFTCTDCGGSYLFKAFSGINATMSLAYTGSETSPTTTFCFWQSAPYGNIEQDWWQFFGCGAFDGNSGTVTGPFYMQVSIDISTGAVTAVAVSANVAVEFPNGIFIIGTGTLLCGQTVTLSGANIGTGDFCGNNQSPGATITLTA